MKTVAFVETNFSGLYAIEYCRAQGYRTVLITDSYERFKRWFPESVLSKLDLVDEIITVPDSSDVDSVLGAIKSCSTPVDAILTFAEIRTKTVACLCEALGLRGANVTAVEIAQDKHRFREILREKGVEAINSIKLEPSELDALDQNAIKFPCFIKPVRGHSSIGAMVCRSLDNIREVLFSLSQTAEDCISSSIVIEDYLVGNLISVEILTTERGKHQIVGIADRDTVKDSVEIGASFPLRHVEQAAIEAKACAALDAIGYDFGASHVELILTETGPYLVEVNTRVGGSGHSVMLDLSTSRSIVGDCVELALGQLAASTTTRLYQHAQGAAWKCLVHPLGGIIKALPSLESIKEKTGVVEVWFHHTVGDELGALNSNFNWIVQVMCTGLDQMEAKKNAASAVEFIASNMAIE